MPTVPYSHQHPQHAERQAECTLICQLIWSVYGTWLGTSGNAQAEEDLEVIASTAKKIVPKALARR